MSSFVRRLQKKGSMVGVRNPDCECCARKELREAKRKAKAEGNHVL